MFDLKTDYEKKIWTPITFNSIYFTTFKSCFKFVAPPFFIHIFAQQSDFHCHTLHSMLKWNPAFTVINFWWQLGQLKLPNVKHTAVAAKLYIAVKNRKVVVTLSTFVPLGGVALCQTDAG